MNKVAVSFEKAKVSQAVYDQYVEDCLNNPDAPLNWTEIGRLGKIANDADKVLLAARHDALNPDTCTCTPDSIMACEVCRTDSQERYGENIPFED